MKSIYLIGFMGSGKTTVAQALTEEIPFTLYEMDKMIEQKEGKKITDIFAQSGEEYFRKLETELLRELPSENAVISTGGGAPLKEENAELMSNGAIIFLDVSFNVIKKRLSEDDSRPLWEGDEEKKKRLLEERRPIYKAAADIIIEVDEKSPSMIAKEILQVLK